MFLEKILDSVVQHGEVSSLAMGHRNMTSHIEISDRPDRAKGSEMTLLKRGVLQTIVVNIQLSSIQKNSAHAVDQWYTYSKIAKEVTLSVIVAARKVT